MLLLVSWLFDQKQHKMFTLLPWKRSSPVKALHSWWFVKPDTWEPPSTTTHQIWLINTMSLHLPSLLRRHHNAARGWKFLIWHVLRWQNHKRKIWSKTEWHHQIQLALLLLQCSTGFVFPWKCLNEQFLLHNFQHSPPQQEGHNNSHQRDDESSLLCKSHLPLPTT